MPRLTPPCNRCAHWRKVWFDFGPRAQVCTNPDVDYLFIGREQMPPCHLIRDAVHPCGPEGRYFEPADAFEMVLSRPWATTLLGLAMLLIGLWLGF